MTALRSETHEAASAVAHLLVHDLFDAQRFHDVRVELRMGAHGADLFAQQLTDRAVELRADLLRLVAHVQHRDGLGTFVRFLLTHNHVKKKTNKSETKLRPLKRRSSSKVHIAKKENCTEQSIATPHLKTSKHANERGLASSILSQHHNNLRVRENELNGNVERNQTVAVSSA